MEQTLALFFSIYVGIVLINVLLTGFQFWAEREPAHKAIFLYWLGALLSGFANGFFKDNDIKIIVVASIGHLPAVYFLSSFFVRLFDLELQFKKFLFIYLVGLLLGVGMYFAGFPFEIYCYPILIGATVPLPAALYMVYKRKKRSFTNMQKMFVVTGWLITIHFMDWPFFRLRPDLLLIGFGIAMVFLQVLSVLTPFMANERSLQRRNDRLEEEVQAKVKLLSVAEQKMWESNKMASLGRMAGGVAHEINNPLQVLVLHAENLTTLAENNELKPSSALEIGTRIKALVQRIAKITNSLRMVARDSRTTVMQEANLANVIEDAISLCADRMKTADIQFKLDIPDLPMPLMCNAIEISQVILNLLSNAIDAVENEKRKEILLHVRPVGKSYHIVVEDSGQLDPAIASKVMDPFFTTKPIGKGTGLGLSISRSIAELHHGTLKLESYSPKTRFLLELPKN